MEAAGIKQLQSVKEDDEGQNDISGTNGVCSARSAKNSPQKKCTVRAKGAVSMVQVSKDYVREELKGQQNGGRSNSGNKQRLFVQRNMKGGVGNVCRCCVP